MLITTRSLLVTTALLGALSPTAAGAQPPARVAWPDTAPLATIFRTAVREGLTTAHGAVGPELVCIGLAGDVRGASFFERLTDPPEAVLADLRRDRSLLLRPSSVCTRLAFDPDHPRMPRVQETRSGRRGILVWVETPKQLADGTFSVHFGYYEHELSGGDWSCTLRRRAGGWEVAACQLLGIS